MKRVCVFGAGAIGGHIAAKLAQQGIDVSIVARGAHLDAIRRDGLRFVSDWEDFVVRVPASDDARDLGPQDLVITAVKSTALPSAADGIAALLHEDTPVIFAINGIPWWYFHGAPEHLQSHGEAGLKRLDPNNMLRSKIGVERAIGCVIRSPNEVIAPGVVRNARPLNTFALGEPDGRLSDRLGDIIDFLYPALPGVSATDRIRDTLWDKLLLNVAGSPLSTIVTCPWIEFIDDPEMLGLFRTLVEEASAVAVAAGARVTTTADDLVKAMREVRHPPSMLVDLIMGRPIESDAVVRAVQDMARDVGVATPVLDVIAPLLEHRSRAALDAHARRNGLDDPSLVRLEAASA